MKDCNFTLTFHYPFDYGTTLPSIFEFDLFTMDRTQYNGIDPTQLIGRQLKAVRFWWSFNLELHTSEYLKFYKRGIVEIHKSAYNIDLKMSDIAGTVVEQNDGVCTYTPRENPFYSLLDYNLIFDKDMRIVAKGLPRVSIPEPNWTPTPRLPYFYIQFIG